MDRRGGGRSSDDVVSRSGNKLPADDVGAIGPHAQRKVVIVFSPVQRWEILSQRRDRETFEGGFVVVFSI